MEVNGEEKGTLVDKEEEVLEDAWVDDNVLRLSPEQLRINAEVLRQRDEQFERELKEIEDEMAKEKEAKKRGISIEELESEEKGEDKSRDEDEDEGEDNGPPRRMTKTEELAEKIEIQKQKTELAKLKKSEVEAGGGGFTGLVKRTVKDVTQETHRGVKRGVIRKSRDRMARGQRVRRPNYSMYSLSSMKQLTVPRGSRAGAVRGIRVSSGSGVPTGGGGLPELRRISTPSGTGMGMMRLGINTRGMKPMGLAIGKGAKPAGVKISSAKPMKLNINSSGLKPMSLAVKGGTVKKSKKRINNRRYNRNVKNLLRIERI